MFIAILLATALGTFATLWAFEHQAYHYGVTAKFNSGYSHGKQSMDRMANWVGGTLDTHPNVPGTTAIGIGLLTTLALAACRLRWFGFPFHPIGYAISSSWAIGLVWLPMLIAWLLKGFTMRYGGLRAYKQFLPFFSGADTGRLCDGQHLGSDQPVDGYPHVQLLWRITIRTVPQNRGVISSPGCHHVLNRLTQTILCDVEGALFDFIGEFGRDADRLVDGCVQVFDADRVLDGLTGRSSAVLP